MVIAQALEFLDTTHGVLDFARAQRLAAEDCERDVARAAAAWVSQHSSESADEQQLWIFADGLAPLAGPGSPEITLFCVAEFAAVLGMSTNAGQIYLGDVIELRYRLPQIWSRIMAGDLVVWKARRIAQATRCLPMEAARYVDRHLAPTAHKLRPCELDRAVEAAELRYEPDAALARAELSAESRRFDIDTQDVGADGLVGISGVLDLPDALDLETAIAREAHALLGLGSTDTLNVRRAQAAGVLARKQTTLDLGPGAESARSVNLYVHLDPADGTASVENTRSTLTIEQIRAWRQTSDTAVTIRPVIDLNQQIECAGYEPSDTLREQVVLRDRTCVFPYCGRIAGKADLDHIEEHRRGGATSTKNLAPVCRWHHRLKTFTAWTYQALDPGVYEWISPHGHRFRRDRHGTIALPDRDPPER